MKELIKLRKEIDEIDHKIIELLAERTIVVYKISRHKSRNNMLVVDEGREKEILVKINKYAEDYNLSSEFVNNLYKSIIEYCRGIQRIRN
ncbi:MAG: chorismate mutase [Patescibacteria group bacterium]